jgi:ABC-2 type transport system ATP-binding protein
MSIKVQEITKLYGTQKALDKVSFEIAPGEVVGLLGPNGAGKSTIMKIITCFIPPTSGSASVCNFDIFEQSIEIRKKVGYLPENNPLYMDLYVKEFLEFIAGIYYHSGVSSALSAVHGSKSTVKDGQIKARSFSPVKILGVRGTWIARRVDEMIELTGLGPEQQKKIGALSRGYRQRVGLAQALLHDPEVLILDEPTSGLDPNQLLEIRGLIREIGKEKTVMLSTHIMQEVEAICDRAIIIHKGKIVADDSTKNLQNMASSRTIIDVEFDRPADFDSLRKIPGIEDIKKISGVSCRLTADVSRDIRPDVFKYAVDNKLTVLSMHREEQKLEEVFQELTRN